MCTFICQTFAIDAVLKDRRGIWCFMLLFFVFFFNNNAVQMEFFFYFIYHIYVYRTSKQQAK